MNYTVLRFIRKTEFDAGSNTPLGVINASSETIQCPENIEKDNWLYKEDKIYIVHAVLFFPNLIEGTPEENPIYEIEKIIIVEQRYP